MSSQRRLLIMGGNPETGQLVRRANEMGVATIVVDPNPQAPAKTDASEHFEIDGFDVQAIAKVARERSVDGVLVGVADVLVQPYLKVCQELGLPCYANEASAEAFSGKEGFSEVCAQYEVPQIPGIVVEAGEFPDALFELPLPLMVKPVDSGGGLGLRICTEHQEVVEAIPDALRYSRAQKVLVERYMVADDMLAYYTFVEGDVFLSATADRITSRRQGPLSPVCLAARYPSKHTDAFMASMNPKLTQLFKELDVQYGVLCIQFFVEDGIFYAYDPGFRLQGEAPHVHLQALNGIDHMKLLIDHALGESTSPSEFARINDFTFAGRRAATFWVLLGAGCIGTIQGLDSITSDPRVVSVIQRLDEGDVVGEDMIGTERQVFARIYVNASTDRELAECAISIAERLQIKDSNGNDMIIDWVDHGLLS